MRRFHFITILFLSVALSGRGIVHATDFTIGNPSHKTDNFDSLEALRLSAGNLGDGDTITLYTDDNTLKENVYAVLSDGASFTFQAADSTTHIVKTNQTGVDNGGVLGISNPDGSATLHLGGVHFNGNQVVGDSNGYGGAIHASGGLVIDTTSPVFFTENTVVNNSADNTGRGGAIYSHGPLVFQDGDFTFANNSATGNDGLDTGHGGAVYALNTLDFLDGTYVFSDNSVFGGDGVTSGLGGAIYSDKAVNFHAGTYTFTGNSATGADGSNSGSAGAIWGMGDIAFYDGNYTFSNNTVTAGSSDSAGLGGAILGQYDVTFQKGNYVFTDNVANGGTGAATGYGGAIWAYEDLLFQEGDYVFSGNVALGKDGDSSGFGGAILSRTTIEFQDGNFEFTNNSASGNGTNSGRGGAIYARGTWDSLDGNHVYSGNTATGGDGNMSGHGGAVYANGVMNWQGGTYTFSNNTAIGTTGDNSGLGGAVYALSAATFADGTYEFSRNSVKGGDGDYSGYGAAIYVYDALDFLDGNYTFSENAAIGGDGLKSGNGGALWAEADMTFHDGTYLFLKNSAIAGLNSGAAETDPANMGSGLGGSILAYTSLTFKDGTYHFVENSAIAGNGDNTGIGGAMMANNDITFQNGTFVFSKNSALSGIGSITGNGGAVYNNGILTFQDGNYLFSENFATGQDGTFSGRGGAILNNNGIAFEGGNYEFVDNYVTGGTGNNSAYGGVICSMTDFEVTGGSFLFARNSATAGTGDNSAYGGAIYMVDNAVWQGGDFVFSDNSAVGGDGNASGRGGAIYVHTGPTGNSNFIVTGGTYMFRGNSAVGGSGDNSGLGGAIYAGTNDTALTNVTFLDNTALTNNPSDATSGRGGAIFVDASADTTFALNVTDDTILFRGNMQGDASAPVPNGIYFGSTTAGTDTFNVKTTFDVDGHFDPVHDFNVEHSILMYDPIESQGSIAGMSNVNLDIAKTGSGLWLLGGESKLDSAAKFSVDEGHFWLYRWSSLNLNDATTADVTVKADAWFHPTIQNDGNVSTITANTFNAEDGARMKTVGLSTLSVGDHTLENAIILNDPNPDQTSYVSDTFVYTPPPTGTMFDEAKYVFNSATGNYDLVVTDVKNMHEELGADPFWDTYRKQVLSDEERSIFDWIYELGVLRGLPDPEGPKGTDLVNIPNLKRTDAMMFRNVLLDRMCVCGCSSAYCCRTPCSPAQYGTMPGSRQLWGTITHNWAELDDIEYRPTAFTFGLDRQVGRWHLGIAGQYLNGNFKKYDDIVTRGRSQNFALGLYAGKCGPRWYAKGMMQFAGGWNDVDTYYTKSDDGTSGYFNSATLGTSLEFGRHLRFGCAANPLTITPHAGFDYIFINAEAFDERGSNFQRSFGSVNYNVAEIPFGFRVEKTFAFEGGWTNRLCPNIDLVYVRSVGDNAPSTTAHYLESPDAAWQVSGTKIGRDVFRLDFGLDGRFIDRIDTRLSYQLETRDKYDSHQLNASMAYCW